MQVLDDVLRRNGHLDAESALIYRYRSIGIGGRDPLGLDCLDEATRAGMKAGFDDALTIVQSASTQLGTALGSTGWRRGNPGANGYNYLWRAATNLMGLGANIVEECQAFNCFRDATGERLDGSSGSYRVHFTSRPRPTRSGH